MASIRQAALEEFSQFGFRGASTQSIADRAGLSKPQLHYYIAGKEELYEDILSRVLAGRLVSLSGQQGKPDPAGALASYIRRKLDYSMDNPSLSRVFTQEIIAGGPYLAKHWPQAAADVLQNVAIIEQWIAQGLIKPVNARLLLIHIWAMTQYHADSMAHTQAVFDLGAPQSISRETIAAEIIAMILAHCGLPH
jgi:TetR/AcrR family transcriptional regulator